MSLAGAILGGSIQLSLGTFKVIEIQTFFSLVPKLRLVYYRSKVWCQKKKTVDQKLLKTDVLLHIFVENLILLNKSTNSLKEQHFLNSSISFLVFYVPGMKKVMQSIRHVYNIKPITNASTTITSHSH